MTTMIQMSHDADSCSARSTHHTTHEHYLGYLLLRLGYEQNMKHLMEIVEERKKRYENSRWERFSDWMSDNPVVVIIICCVLLGIFVIGVFVKLGVKQREPAIGSRQHRKVDPPGKKTPDEMRREAKKMREAFQKYRESVKQRETATGKKPFDEL